MTPPERDLIIALFNRLQQATNQPVDREAETLIADGLKHVPDAPYLLVQTVLIQDMALAEAQHRIADLERQAAAAAPPQQSTSFLAGARGSVPAAGPWGSRSAAPAAPAAPQQGGPVWTQSSAAGSGQAAAPSMVAPLAAPGASSGFLRQAATTAAGIAGGTLLFQGISSLFGPHYGPGFFSGIGAQPGLGETVINNYYDSPPPAGDPSANADWSGSDPGDFGGADPGGGVDI